MYIFVNFQEEESYYKDGSSKGLVKARLEQVSGERCLVVPYQEFNMSVVEQFKPTAIAMSGFAEPGEAKGFIGVAEVLEKCEVPMICFCGSHQLIDGCLTHGFGKSDTWKRADPMRKISPDEDLPRVPKGNPYDRSEYFVAGGFFPIKQLKDDPIFAGLPNPMIMKCAHYCEIKVMPVDFELLASSGHCKIAMIKHKTRTFYGTQFHPEGYAEPWMHGKKLLENFAIIAKKYWETKK
jgi:anthranilate/para-aminobenzoate synthase component II